MSIQNSMSNEINLLVPEIKEGASDEVNEEKRSKRLNNDITEQDKNERKIYANLIYTLIAIWLTLVLIIFIASGKGDLKYSDSVLITLITTATANVIILFNIVVKYLFNAKK